MHMQVCSICCPIMITTLHLKLPRKLSKKHLYRTQTSSHIPTAFPRVYKVNSNASTVLPVVVSALVHSNSQGSKLLMQIESELPSCTITSPTVGKH